MFKKTYILYLLLLTTPVLIAQKQRLDVRVSNDKFFLVDKYFTSGVYLSYKKRINKDFVFKKNANAVLQYSLTAGNEVYTPQNLDSFNSLDFDRPYAGWFFVDLEIAKLKTKSALFLGLETGITGKPSFAGQLQIKFHELFNIESRPTWVDEIYFNWLLNIKVLQVNNLYLNKKSELQNHFTTTVGSKDFFVKNQVYYFLGNFNGLQNSSRLPNTIGNGGKELFCFLSAGYKYVLYNALIQGSLFSNKDAFITQITPHVFTFSIGTGFQFKNNNLKLECFYNTKETPKSSAHAYASITYGFLF